MKFVGICKYTVYFLLIMLLSWSTLNAQRYVFSEGALVRVFVSQVSPLPLLRVNFIYPGETWLFMKLETALWNAHLKRLYK